MMSARLPDSSGVTTSCKTCENEQNYADRDARIRDVEDVRPDAVKIDEIDDEAKMQPVDDVTDCAAQNHAERNTHEQRVTRLFAERKPKDEQHDKRHPDQQNRRGAEQTERAMLILLVRPAQQAWNDQAAFTRQKLREDQALRELIERNHDRRYDEQLRGIRASAAGQIDRTSRRFVGTSW